MAHGGASGGWGLARLSLGVQVLEAASSVIVHLEAAD